MNNVDFTEAQESCLKDGPQSVLEKRFIKEYLLNQGYQLKDLERLPEQEARQLMQNACIHASLKLAEVEAKAGFLEKIHWPS